MNHKNEIYPRNFETNEFKCFEDVLKMTWNPDISVDYDKLWKIMDESWLLIIHYHLWVISVKYDS